MSTSKQGSNPRRSLLKAGIAAIVVVAAGAAEAQQKIAQKLVQYQETPKNGQKCSDCLQFEAPASCKVVEGKIGANAWCVVFVAKPPAK